jgi:hypothetical protein
MILVVNDVEAEVRDCAESDGPLLLESAGDPSSLVEPLRGRGPR